MGAQARAQDWVKKVAHQSRGNLIRDHSEHCAQKQNHGQGGGTLEPHLCGEIRAAQPKGSHQRGLGQHSAHLGPHHRPLAELHLRPARLRRRGRARRAAADALRDGQLPQGEPAGGLVSSVVVSRRSPQSNTRRRTKRYGRWAAAARSRRSRRRFPGRS